jgi:hypothetical protein
LFRYVTFGSRYGKTSRHPCVLNEIDHTIYPYTVGREDCKVLPRSFETLAEGEAYLAQQDRGALERGEFYLDGPEQDKAVLDRAHNADGTHRI